MSTNRILEQTFSSEFINKAREYAILKHSETNHKYDGKPYDVHLKMVYDFGCKYIHILPNNETIEEVLASCWTHDVIEDCRETYNDVKKVLGEKVADIVYALSNEKGKNRRERANSKYYEGIRNTPFATYVKICDRLANVSYSKQSGSRMFESYRKENEHFKKQLWSIEYQEMFNDLDNLLAEKKYNNLGESGNTRESKPDLGNVLYEFVFSDCIQESPYVTISLHRTRKGAETAMQLHKEEKRKEFYETYQYIDQDPPYEFGTFERWDVIETEVLE